MHIKRLSTKKIAAKKTNKSKTNNKMTALNSTLKNGTLGSESCISVIFAADFTNITLNIIRSTVSLLLIIWIVLLMRIKELRRREMAFLNNLNAISAFFCITSLYYLFYASCYQMSDLQCSIQSFAAGYVTILPNYGLIGLVLYRLYCATAKPTQDTLKLYKIGICLAATWIFPAVLFFLRWFFGSKLKSAYHPVFRACLIEPSHNVASFIFQLSIAFLIPNVSIIWVYVYLLIKSKAKVSPVNRAKKMPRVTVQVVIYIGVFEMYCVFLSVAFYQSSFGVADFPADFLKFIRVFNWFNLFSPLGLFYLHNVMLKKYKKLYKRVKQIIEDKISN